MLEYDLGDAPLLSPLSLLTKQRMLSCVHFLLEVCLYLLPLFFLFKGSYATALYVWIFGFFGIAVSIEKRLPKFGSPVSVPVILLLLAVTVPSMFTIGPANTWREAKHLLYGACLFFLLIDQIAHRKRILRRYLFLLLGVSIFLSLDALWQLYAGIDIMGRSPLANRATAVFSKPNYLGFMLSAAVPVYVYFAKSKRSKVGRAVPFMLLMFCLAAIIFSGCRSAWGALILYAIWAIADLGKRNSLIYAVLLISVVCLAGQGIINARFIETTHFLKSDRIIIWKDAIDIIKIHPLLGSGLDSYKYLAPKVPSYPYHYSAPHFFPFEIWQSSGIIALCCFLYLLYKIVAVNIEYIKDRGPYAFLFFSWIMVFATSVISIPFFSRYVSFYFWLILGLLFGAMKIRSVPTGGCENFNHSNLSET